MPVIFLFFTLAGLGLFYLQTLLHFSQVQLCPLNLFIFYVALRYPLWPAFFLGVLLGLVQDSYALTPFGLHLTGSLILVAAARFCRGRFLLKTAGPRVLACLAALTLQELGLRLTLALLEARPFLTGDLVWQRAPTLLFTTALGPLMFSLLSGLEGRVLPSGRGKGRVSADSGDLV